jgi:thiamine-phosphate pyrophosphorylase
MNTKRNDRIRGLYAITPEEQDTAELLRKVRLALLGGARVLQYRNKIAGQTARLEQARALRELTNEFDVPLIINDDVMLAHEIGADGVHLGKSDDSIIHAREVLGSGKLIGMSCYNRLVLAHEAVKRDADYVAFGSFFVSKVKPDAVAAMPELLRQAHSDIALPLVAIGGITILNGPQLLEAGADALAVISALFGAKDIEGTARQFANLNFS